MAMKKCRECGHSISSSAKVCTSCGIKKPYISPFKGIFLLAVIGWAGWVVFTDDKPEPAKDVVSAGNSESTFAPSGMTKMKVAAPVDLPSAETRPFSTAQVCKAAIAGMMGRDMGTLKAAKANTAGVYKISYRRPSDGNQYSIDCKLSGNNVIWTESGQSTNRWNGKGNVDFNVEFAINDASLTITELYANSDDSAYSYTMKDFR